MKKIQLFSLLFILVCALSACKKDNPEVGAVAATFQVKFDEQIAGLGLSPLNTEITLTNQVNGQINKAKADANGLVTFSSIIPGKYIAVATLTIKAKDYSNLTGVYTAEDVVFNANINAVVGDNSGTLVLNMKTGRLGDWVLKQIYYGGSSTTDGAVFRDQFIEIYNNSNEIMYADSLCIALVNGVNSITQDLTKPWFLSTGQFDWTKSLTMNNSKANSDYIYATTIVRIPGTGKKYPVEPGKSIIIAQNALNHKAPYTNNAGKEVGVKRPELTVDLSHADFEAYYGDLPGINVLATDIDNPLVPNLVVLYRISDRDLILDARGQEAIVLFKTKNDISSFPKFPAPDALAITSSTAQYVQLPNSMIIDGVELAATVDTKRVPHRLPSEIDAGFTFVPGGSYSSQSVIRKTGKTVNGRKVLKDSNNSSEDFDYLLMADPSKNAFK
ncbi:DUF4876 domain-containing protein [Pedobacter nutrimenti]|jgi:hypothetical protein|uniref:Uncharacterized protein DUF4876 n=1 Tax=Pedobacter nutrimenti TaxID=1241337 RepID=A0A318UC35_9SPHI|nr:DUF4876 domain-containing protein [Pedobacter nutrimenti]PYF71512.1 uncharacterized protein DUF4876 [Pedobacter nutrimenti]